MKRAADTNGDDAAAAAKKAAPEAPSAAGQHKTRNLIFREHVTEDVIYSMPLKSVLFSGASDFQTVQVLELEPYGRTLVMDRTIQSTEADEWIYHETLVHVAMAHCKTPPKRVFIGGGGEGGTLREVLRHTSVERVDMVDIDGVAVAMCREHMPSLSAGAFEDARANLVIADAAAFLRASRDTYDVMIFDLCDPLDAGPAYMLYTQEFYADVVRPRLAADGVFVTQAGPAGLFNLTQCFTPIVRTVGAVFPASRVARAFIPAYCDAYGFSIGFNGAHATPDAVTFEATARARLADFDALRFLDGDAFIRVLSQPRHVKRALADEKRVLTQANPLNLKFL